MRPHGRTWVLPDISFDAERRGVTRIKDRPERSGKLADDTQSEGGSTWLMLCCCTYSSLKVAKAECRRLPLLNNIENEVLLNNEWKITWWFSHDGSEIERQKGQNGNHGSTTDGNGSWRRISTWRAVARTP